MAAQGIQLLHGTTKGLSPVCVIPKFNPYQPDQEEKSPAKETPAS